MPEKNLEIMALHTLSYQANISKELLTVDPFIFHDICNTVKYYLGAKSMHHSSVFFFFFFFFGREGVCILHRVYVGGHSWYVSYIQG